MKEREDLEELTEGAANEIVWQIRDGEHEPEQARRLLQQFLDVTETGRPDQKILPSVLLEFLRAVFAEYLKDPKKGRLEKLLGLVRSSKRPVSNESGISSSHMKFFCGYLKAGA